jgi:uncharacterized glyoxalase superfamily metalloenzyme YdcJ
MYRHAAAARGPAAQLEAVPALSLDALIAAGHVIFHPIVYEDFLPVSAAGIFRSNLGDGAAEASVRSPDRRAFEEAPGAPVTDEFSLYEAIEQASTRRCLQTLNVPPPDGGHHD